MAVQKQTGHKYPPRPKGRDAGIPTSTVIVPRDVRYTARKPVTVRLRDGLHAGFTPDCLPDYVTARRAARAGKPATQPRAAGKPTAASRLVDNAAQALAGRDITEDELDAFIRALAGTRNGARAWNGKITTAMRRDARKMINKRNGK